MKIYPNDTIEIMKYEHGAPKGSKVKVVEVNDREVKYKWKGMELLAGIKYVELVRK